MPALVSRCYSCIICMLPHSAGHKQRLAARRIRFRCSFAGVTGITGKSLHTLQEKGTGWRERLDSSLRISRSMERLFVRHLARSRISASQGRLIAR